jgi:hypothetical protein
MQGVSFQLDTPARSYSTALLWQLIKIKVKEIRKKDVDDLATINRSVNRRIVSTVGPTLMLTNRRHTCG